MTLSRMTLGVALLLWMVAAGLLGFALIPRQTLGIPNTEWWGDFGPLIIKFGYAAIALALLGLILSVTLCEQHAVRRRQWLRRQLPAAADDGAGDHGKAPAARTSSRERNAMLLILVLFFLARLLVGFRGGGGFC